MANAEMTRHSNPSRMPKTMSSSGLLSVGHQVEPPSDTTMSAGRCTLTGTEVCGTQEKCLP